MKKYLTLLLVLVLALGLTACGSSSAGDTNTPAGSDSQQQESTPSSPDGEGTLGKYAVKFTGYTLAKDYQGQDTVIISFDFTNNNENATSAMVALNIDAYQDGIELESAILTDAVAAVIGFSATVYADLIVWAVWCCVCAVAALVSLLRRRKHGKDVPPDEPQI